MPLVALALAGEVAFVSVETPSAPLGLLPTPQESLMPIP
jgi:hypothetical protein